MQPLRDLVSSALADPETGWSLGTFGAAAEFRRRPDEPAEPLRDGRLGLATRRGGIALGLRPDLVPVAYETALPGGWSHAVALCLPADSLRGPARRTCTELGPDRAALRPEASGRILFDLGLGLAQVDVCLRSDAPEVLARIRRAAGPVALDEGILADLRAGRLGLVFAGPLGRIEVEALGAPPGPRAYAPEAVLRLGRSHAATAPIPPGLVPVAHIHPAHPLRDALGRPRPFEARHHAGFQALLERWGDPDLLAWKRHRLGLGPRPGRPPDRRSRGAERVAAIQAACGAYPEAAQQGEAPAASVTDS